jgi:hypothetical protein
VPEKRPPPSFFFPVLNAGAGKKNFPEENPGGIVQEFFFHPNSFRGKPQEFKKINFLWEFFSCGARFL